jgi:hypothetical protein
MATSSKQIKPNDVAIILRPAIVEGKEWDGDFEIVIGGYGPFTMKDEEVHHMVMVATMMAATISLMEEDEELTNRVHERCQEIYGEEEVAAMNETSKDIVLDEDTPTYGRMC